MKKVLCSLIVLAVLVGMFVCLGAQAFADGEQAAIFAVSGAELSVDSIGALQEKAPDCLVVDVDGLAESQAGTGYNVVWKASDPMVMTDVAYVWPGFAQMFYVGANSDLVVLVGVDDASTPEQIEAAIADYLGDDPYVIAVGTSGAAAAIGGCTNVDMFMTYITDDAAASEAASAVGAAKLANVGKDESNPVCHVVLGEDGTVTVEAIPVPAASEGQGVGPVVPVPEEQSQQPEEQQQPPVDQPVAPPEATEAPVATCEILYKGGEGSEGSMPDDHAFQIGNTLTFPENTYYTKSGCEFDGWKVEQTGEIYQPYETMVVNGTINVTAQWEEIAAVPFTVTYKADGQADVVDTVLAENADSYVLRGEGTFAPAEKKALAGWKSDDPADPAELGLYNPYPLTKNVVFTALWSDVYTVSYDANGGSGEMTAQTILSQIGGGADFDLPTCAFTAPDGKVFAGWKANDGFDTLYTPAPGKDVQYHLVSDVTFTAQWVSAAPETTDAPEETEPPVATTYTVTYKDGEASFDGGSFAAGETITLKTPEECGFTVPDGKAFGAWFDGAIDATGTYVMPEQNVTFTAVWNDAVPTYSVTYKAGDAAAIEGNADVKDENLVAGEIVLRGNPFKAPEGKVFANWLIGEATYDGLAKYQLTGDLEAVAQWKDAPKENQTVTTINGDNKQLQWTRGGTDNDKPTVTFVTAQIDSVLLNGAPLVENSQVVVNGSTMALEPNYLNTLNQGSYNLTVTFNDDQTGSYNDYIMTLSVTLPPASTPDTTLPDDRTVKQDWNRGVDWSFTFSSAPAKVEIYYGKDTSGKEIYQEAKKDTDYTVSGNTLTLKPVLVNGNWGGVWPNARYSFRVTLTDNSVYVLQLQLTGDTPATTTAPTATPVPTNASGVPVTGDETPITMYIVVLLVLIIALAGVLIFVMKRRSSGGRGKHDM